MIFPLYGKTKKTKAGIWGNWGKILFLYLVTPRTEKFTGFEKGNSSPVKVDNQPNTFWFNFWKHSSELIRLSHMLLVSHQLQNFHWVKLERNTRREHHVFGSSSKFHTGEGMMWLRLPNVSKHQKQNERW